MLGLINLCITPSSIFSPIPFFAISLFTLAYNQLDLIISSLHLLIIGTALSLLSSFASNLWNHTNDLREDVAQGKETVLTQNIVSHRTAIFLSVFLYGISIMITLYASIAFEKPIYIFFMLWVVVTWWYSDNIFLKRLFGFRLKTHYVGEIITYGIAYPSYTLSIWLIYSNLNISGFALALAFSFFGVSGVLLKDLKDISGDRKAGLRTFGVMFTPSKLLYFSCIFLFLYYFVFLDFIALKVFASGMLLILIPFIWYIRDTFFYFNKKNWKLGVGDFRSIHVMITSTYLSIVILGIGAFF